MQQDIKEVLVSQDQIQAKVKELGRELGQYYKDKNPLCIGILKGAVPFASDLIQAMECPLEIDFMAVSSYGNSTNTSGAVRIIKDIESSIEDRDVLVMEDIIDTGLTLRYLVSLLNGRGARSVKTIAFLDKPSRRQEDFEPDYIGFQIPDHYVVGYGLDYAGRYRNLPYVGVLKEEIYRS